jgi:Tol biopolymer transport system component
MRILIGCGIVAACALQGATLAYVDARGHLVYQAAGARPRVVDHHGYEPSLRADGKRLAYTRQITDDGRPNTLMVFDAETGTSRELVTGYVGTPMWSPDGILLAYQTHEEKSHVWIMDPARPKEAKQLSSQEMITLASWTPSGDAVVAYDMNTIYWIGLDGAVRKTLAGSDVYGKDLEWMSSNQIRVHPRNADLLLVSAYTERKELVPVIVIYDLKSGKRTSVLASTNWGQDAHWSPDGAWLYFAHGEGRTRRGIWRVHADGSGLERVTDGVSPDVSR